MALELYDLYRSYEGSPNVQRRKSIFSLLSGMLEGILRLNPSFGGDRIVTNRLDENLFSSVSSPA